MIRWMPGTILVNASPFLILLGLVVWWGLRGAKRWAAPPVGPDELEHLVPREAYDADETGYWARLPWSVGVMFGAAMAVASLILPPGGLSAVEVILIGVGAGLFFGLLFPRTFRKSMTKLSDGIYAGDAKLIDLPSRSAGFRYGLPCTWIDGRFGIGGVLCAGAAGVRFVPHKKNMRRPAPFDLGPIAALRLELVPPQRGNALRRLVVPNPPPLLEIRGASASARFLIPCPGQTLGSLKDVLGRLQTAEKE